MIALILVVLELSFYILPIFGFVSLVCDNKENYPYLENPPISQFYYIPFQRMLPPNFLHIYHVDCDSLIGSAKTMLV